jgi:lipopolysaccharide biosynthesis glycosyltransferase
LSTLQLLVRMQAKPITPYIASKKYAIVSLLVLDGFDQRQYYLEGLCKLSIAIDRYAAIDKVLMVVGVGGNFSACGWQTYAVEPIDGPRGIDPHTNRFFTTHMYTKLRLWELVQYEAVLYIDLDTLIIGPFGQLFEVHLPQMLAKGQQIGMGHNHFPEGPDFNAGVILLPPNTTLFRLLVSGIDTVPHDLTVAEQGYLNQYFLERIHLLPFRYNSMVSEKISHPEFWAASEAAILHYTCKPWNAFNCWWDGIEDLCLLWHMYP